MIFKYCKCPKCDTDCSFSFYDRDEFGFDCDSCGLSFAYWHSGSCDYVCGNVGEGSASLTYPKKGDLYYESPAILDYKVPYETDNESDRYTGYKKLLNKIEDTNA